MKIAAAQIRPIKGKIDRNLNHHKKFIEWAVSENTDIIIFPELSLTGYEPQLAKKLATDENDHRLEKFQELSNQGKIIIGVGLPIQNTEGICVSMVLFHPHAPRQVYAKRHLHIDEEEYFVSGQNATTTVKNHPNIALAICYEISIISHAQNAADLGANVYLASVAKDLSGVIKASNRLSEIARNYGMTVVMSNCIGQYDNFDGAGRTSIWNDKGQLLCQLNSEKEGVLLFDTLTNKAYCPAIGPG